MQMGLRESRLQLMIKLSSLILVCVAGFAGVFFYKADVKQLLVLAIFMFFYVLLPGAWLISKLKIKNEHKSTAIIRSFFMGFAVNIVLYYITELIGINILLYATGPLMSIMMIIDSVKHNSQDIFHRMKCIWREPSAELYVFAMIVFILSMLTTQYTYISPIAGDYSYLKIDFGFHAGIINSLSHGYKPIDPWVYGRTIDYHYFTEMLYSIPVRLFRLRSEDILMSGTPYICTPVLTLSFYSFFREFTVRSEKSGLYCLLLHFSNIFMLKEFADSWILYHIYSNINNAGMGAACILTMLPFLKLWNSTEASHTKKISDPETLILILFIMLGTGIKAPMMLVVVAAMVGTVSLALILKKANRNMLAVTGISVISFALIYVSVLGLQHGNETGGKLINLWEVTDLFFLKPTVMRIAGGVRLLQGAVLISLFMIFCLTAFFLPFSIGYLRELILVLSARKDFQFSRVVIYAACFVGFIAMMLFDFAGHSQVYFGFVSFIFVPVVSIWLFEDVMADRRRRIKIVRIVFVVCMCVTTASSFLYLTEKFSIAKDVYQSRNDNNNKYKNITTAEYEGLIWLRDNTDKDAIIASDRYYSSKKKDYSIDSRAANTHFGYAVYSMRRQYLEGSGFSLEGEEVESLRDMIKTNNMMFDRNNEDRGEIAKSLGVDYVLVSKRFENPGDLSNADYEECFSNDDITIYRIR